MNDQTMAGGLTEEMLAQEMRYQLVQLLRNDRKEIQHTASYTPGDLGLLGMAVICLADEIIVHCEKTMAEYDAAKEVA